MTSYWKTLWIIAFGALMLTACSNEQGTVDGPEKQASSANEETEEEEAERAIARREADADHDADKHAQAAAAHAASFTEFAARVGAVDLPDLLEAAASYLAFVEEREQFSRPQLMTKVRQVEQEDFNREDSLRHFGRLLREGKLRKVAAGHFAVSDRINFRPEERAAG
mgnify:CR=1 FL=1